MKKWQSYKTTKTSDNVLTQISSQYKLLVESNHMYI